MLSYHPNCETITNNNTNKFTEMIFITNPNIKKRKGNNQAYVQI